MEQELKKYTMKNFLNKYQKHVFFGAVTSVFLGMGIAFLITYLSEAYYIYDWQRSPDYEYSAHHNLGFMWGLVSVTLFLLYLNLYYFLSKKWFKFLQIVGILLGFLVACFMINAAWWHNPQQEFHVGNTAAWDRLAGIFFSWAIAFSGIQLFLTLGVKGIMLGMKKWKKRKE